jgi:hypothetical protein
MQDRIRTYSVNELDFIAWHPAKDYKLKISFNKIKKIRADARI